MQVNLEITKLSQSNFSVLKLKGRIDANWSLRLKEAIDAEIRSGAYEIVLDLEYVDYISSAGVRVLLMSYKELKKLNGYFALYRTAENVKSIISMLGLAELLDCSRFETQKQGYDKDKLIGNESRSNSMNIKLFYKNNETKKCTLRGNVNKINNFSYSESDAYALSIDEKTIAFGLGALGEPTVESVARAGEFLAAGNFAAYMPSDGSKKPDFMIGVKGFNPIVSCLYSAESECGFSQAFAFSPADKKSSRLSEIIKTAHELSEANDILSVIIGETSGLIGASLAKSPSENKQCSDPFGFPEIKNAFNITTEPSYIGSIALCIGISSKKSDDRKLNKFLRPLASDSIISGHFHAAVFPYMPIKKDCHDFREILSGIYENTQPDAIIHLINDWRNASGTGETEFSGGICWSSVIGNYDINFKED